jgi:hypothetical protein
MADAAAKAIPLSLLETKSHVILEETSDWKAKQVTNHNGLLPVKAP